MRKGHAAPWIMLGVLLAFSGCNKTGTSSDATNGTAATPAAGDNSSAASGSAATSAPAAAPAPAPVVVSAGRTLTVTVDQDLSTKTNNKGDRFEASLAEPVTVDGNDVLPKGAHVRGTVTESASAGHLKGGAVLAITLDAVTVHGKSYSIETDSHTVEGKARGKRTAIGAGGGAAIGAIVGALAGGGKGAAIGAGAGAGAGTAGAAYTGDRDVSIPAETAVHFKLTRSISIAQ